MTEFLAILGTIAALYVASAIFWAIVLAEFDRK
jgi:hypothetical protein